MSKKRIVWKSGDIFSIKLSNDSYCFGQILDLQMENVVRCALFNEISPTTNGLSLTEICSLKNLISLVATTREQLDYDIWKIIGYKVVEVSQENYPNEQFRNNGWVGAKIYDAAIIETFLEAYFGLMPWDAWADPQYFDKLLIDKSKKPDTLLYKTK
jgi:hypothetical protein